MPFPNPCMPSSSLIPNLLCPTLEGPFNSLTYKFQLFLDVAVVSVLLCILGATIMSLHGVHIPAAE
jgi:hypothetical protein